VLQAAKVLSSVLKLAIAHIKKEGISVYTFAFYHDHESGAVSVCVDTRNNSEKSVKFMNDYNMGHFFKAVAKGDLKGASLWQANIGRSLSLGDFALVNTARTDIANLKIDEQFYVTMVQELVAVQGEIASLSDHPEHLVFACSGAGDEVAFVWSLPNRS
jgi:hypothetical protein